MISVAGCQPETATSTGDTIRAGEYIPVCFREVPPSQNVDPICPEGFVLHTDYSENTDYCCEGGIAMPGEGGEGNSSSSGAKLCVAVIEDYCPFSYTLAVETPGPDCELSGCAAAGYDTHPVTGECSCACAETLTQGTEQTALPEKCPDLPGLILIGYEIDGGVGNTDVCTYRDFDPTLTTIETRLPSCSAGTLQTRQGQDYCLLDTLCPGGTIAQPDGSCGTCSFPCESINHTQIGSGHVLFLLDKSGSMTDPYTNGQTRWAAAKQAIGTIVQSSGPIDFGLQLFSNDNACSADSIAVPIGPQTTAPIIETMDATYPSGATPIAAALETAYNQGFTNTPVGTRKIVVLVGDGGESCTARNKSIEAATDAYIQSDIQTFVISLNASGANTNTYLSTLAQAGGTGAAIIPSSVEEIVSSINDTALTTCTYPLSESQAANTTDIEVILNDQVIPQNNWHLDGSFVVIGGPSCDTITSGGAQSITINTNCSE